MTRQNFCAGLSYIAIASLACIALAQAPAGPYKVLKIAKVGGLGGFDYLNADAAGRKLYIPRSGAENPRISVFNLDTLAPITEIPSSSAHGVVIDPKSHHAFATGNPVPMWDTETLKVIKTFDIPGTPDGSLLDRFNDRVWIFSHPTLSATILNPADGTVVGTLELGGTPEEGVTDGQGHLWVGMYDKNEIVEVDTKAVKVLARYDLTSAGSSRPTGLAFDAKNRILFSTCGGDPPRMVILSADTGKILASVPISAGTDGAAFNPVTGEVFSPGRQGALSIVREISPTSFEVEQTLPIPPGAKTLTMDTKTGNILMITAEYEAAPPRAPAATPPAGARTGQQPGGAPGPVGASGGGRGRGSMVADSFSVIVAGR